MATVSRSKIVGREPHTAIRVDGDVLFDLVIQFWCLTITDVIGNDAHFLRSAFEPIQLIFCQFTQTGQSYRNPSTVLRFQNFRTGIRPMIEIPPLRINSRTEQRNIGYLSNDAFQCLKIICRIAIFLGKSVTAVHYKAKSLTVIGHIVVYKFDIVDFLIHEFVIPLDGKFVDLLHVCHCDTPPINHS
ncbi:hypothetical protein FC15_GL000336 [Lapidilactobacillus concavus DSM 17758]|uniref:Uncharacterized protein n=1 Tax=Lapidilactobacillus concavus DSM 17758 TaxID=1423735 RepID=A0A0R1VZT2_9LACO|nr:hypothetical protein FC15_GL000336 [Lapidilactobacillus concavus DSM 17758]